MSERIGPIEAAVIAAQASAAKKRAHLVSFRDGAYKKIVDPKSWNHSQWLHYTKQNGAVVRINLANVNYIEEMDE